MLKKKILGTLLVLWTCIAWITQGAWQWWNYTLPLEFTTNNSDIIIDENLNISNFSWWKIWLFKIQDYNNYIRWNEWKIYWYYNYWNTCRYQWEMDKMCIGTLDQARNPTPVPWICTSNYSSETAEAFYNWEFGTEFETILVMNETNAQALNLCFLDTTDNNTTYCLSAYQRTDKQLPCYTTFEDLQSNIIAWDSPFQWWWESEITPIIYTGTITNQHAIYAYEQLGLTANQCYWWYPIDKLYNTWDILYQWYQAGTGATIIDLYNTNSWNYQGYNSTYMTLEQTKITQFLSENYEGYQTNGLQFFIWKQEALITIMQQYKNWNQQALNKGKEGYSLFQLYTYCDLLINYNNDNEYTGNTATPDMRRNGINSENHNIITPQTGTVFDQLQDEEGNYTRNKAQDIRDTINRVYSKLTTIFKFRSWVEGIIPQEIIRILLIIILFKIFKK